MWREVLQGRQLAGYKFVRQKPIAEYIVDFYCAELKLAVEIDGDTHAEQAEYDARRTERIRALGIRLVRYSNRDVLDNLDGVRDDLIRHAQD
jgi:adenine-specific DNA-methyltransferase